MTNLPVLVPPVTPELSQPWITADGFRAYPTWLDLDNLIPGGVQALQDDELTDVALTATRWCVDQLDQMPLHGHYVQGEQLHTRSGRSGRITVQPRHVPIRALASLAWGFSPETVQPMALPDPSMWFEQGRLFSFRPGGAASLFQGVRIQFGSAPVPQAQIWVNHSYVAGYPSSILQTSCESAASSVEVTDPTSILPGDVLRIYDVGDTDSDIGANEAVTVASSYVPATPTSPPTPTAIPLAAATRFAHQAGTMITGMPRTGMQAVICCMIALLMRDDVSSEEPTSASGISARASNVDVPSRGQAGGLINDALGYLAGHRPVLRSVLG